MMARTNIIVLNLPSYLFTTIPMKLFTPNACLPVVGFAFHQKTAAPKYSQKWSHFAVL